MSDFDGYRGGGRGRPPTRGGGGPPSDYDDPQYVPPSVRLPAGTINRTPAQRDPYPRAHGIERKAVPGEAATDYDGITRPGPLADEGRYEPGHVLPARGFQGGKYSEQTLRADTVLYRSGAAGREWGEFYAEEPAEYRGPRIHRSAKAGGETPAEFRYATTFPKGTRVYRGPGPDGTPAVHIPDACEVAGARVVARMPLQMKRGEETAGRGRAAIPQSGGAPLGSDVRARMESQLGTDLSSVSVHVGAESARAADQLGARAFTVGQDVHFGAGQFVPGTKEGDRLIAHELTHAVQAQKSGIQRKGYSNEEEKLPEKGVDPSAHAENEGNADSDAAMEAPAKAEEQGEEHAVSEPGEPAELEADAVADQVAENLHDGDKKGKDKRKKKGEPKEGKAEPPEAQSSDCDTSSKGTGEAPAEEASPAEQTSAEAESAPEAEPASAAVREAPAIGAKLVARKILREVNGPPSAGPPGSTSAPTSTTAQAQPGTQPGGAQQQPGATEAPPPAPPPVTVAGTMKGAPHTLTADAGAKQVTLDGADAVAAGEAAVQALPEPGDPRHADASAKLAALNAKLAQLRDKVTSGAPPTTDELRALSQETMALMQAFGDQFDVTRLGAPLPAFPGPIVGPHPLTGPKPPDRSSRNSHHVPPKELAQAIANEAQQAADELMKRENAAELAPTAQRLMQAVAAIRGNPNGNGLTAILLHQVTHQTTGGAAVHSASMKPQIVAGVDERCAATQRERILIMNDVEAKLPEGLAVNPGARQFRPFLDQCRAQASSMVDEQKKAAAQQTIDGAEQREQQISAQAQQEISDRAMQIFRQLGHVAFHNTLAQAMSALRAALLASHVDGTLEERNTALASVEAQAPQSWGASILRAGE